MNAQSKEVLEKIQQFDGSVFYLTLLWVSRDVVSGDVLQMDDLDSTLASLERDGLVKLRLEFEPNAGRNRKYLDITALGRESLQSPHNKALHTDTLQSAHSSLPFGCG